MIDLSAGLQFAFFEMFMYKSASKTITPLRLFSIEGLLLKFRLSKSTADPEAPWRHHLWTVPQLAKMLYHWRPAGQPLLINNRSFKQMWKADSRIAMMSRFILWKADSRIAMMSYLVIHFVFILQGI